MNEETRPPSPFSFIIHHSSFRILLLPLITFLFIAPTLNSTEWSFGSEAVNVATALEIRRTGHWLIPTLQGESRINKPPLTAWITAAAITDETLRLISSPNSQDRDRGQSQLAWQARWPSALLLCTSLIAIYELALALRDAEFALLSTVIAASMLLFLRHSRWAQTDTQLAVWVAITNAFLARAIFKWDPWRGFIGAGIALGVAILAKGPIALIMTVLPMSLALFTRRPDSVSPPRRVLAPIILSAICALLIGGSWFAYIAFAVPHSARTFFAEATRYGANQLEPDSLRNYLRGLPILLLPWTPLAAIGAFAGIFSLVKKRLDAAAIAVLLVFIPLLVMLPFKERKERYLAPLLGGSALLAASGATLLTGVRSRRMLLPGAAAIAIAAAAYNLFDARHPDPSAMKTFADAIWKACPAADLFGYQSTDPQSAYLLVPGAEMSIYLNRPVHWTKAPPDIPNAAMFVIGSSNPDLSASWQLLHTETRRHMRRTLYLHILDGK